MEKHQQIFVDKNNNRYIGFAPIVKNSKIIFKGKNNILFCEKNVTIENSTISFEGDNSLIYLSSSKYEYKLNASIFNNSVLAFDKDNYMNSNITIVVSEEKNVLFGEDSTISTGIVIRCADAHLLYDINTKRRINKAGSMYFGDHIWIGQDVLFLKNNIIGSGSVIGAKSVCSNKSIESNCAYAGNPIKKIRSDILYDGRCSHRFVTEDKEDFDMILDSTKYIYKIKKENTIFEQIEKYLSETKEAFDKIEFIKDFLNDNNQFRFSVK